MGVVALWPRQQLIHDPCTKRFENQFAVSLIVDLGRTEAFGIAHKPPLACSARIVVDRQTDRQTKYSKPCCTCAPRVNNSRLTEGLYYSCPYSNIHNGSSKGNVMKACAHAIWI